MLPIKRQQIWHLTILPQNGIASIPMRSRVGGTIGKNSLCSMSSRWSNLKDFNAFEIPIANSPLPKRIQTLSTQGYDLILYTKEGLKESFEAFGRI